MTDGARTKFKIAIVGIGGVGGYIGGKLAARFKNSDAVQIVLTARGENEKAIRAGGLKLITSSAGEEIVKPELADITEIGDADLILLCTKGYGLEKAVRSLKDTIGERTAILPLLNGVDHTEKIRHLLLPQQADVWQGCIYIVSRLTSPGVIEETGSACLIYFGDEKGRGEKAVLIEKIFREAGIDARLVEDVIIKIWEKFVFISSLAAATSYLNARIGEVLSNKEYENLLNELLAEVESVAFAKNIEISETEVRQKFARLNNIPPEATSSMHTDFLQGKETELESLVGYVVREAKKLNVPTPAYDKVYGELSEKQKASSRG